MHKYSFPIHKFAASPFFCNLYYLTGNTNNMSNRGPITFVKR